METASTADQAVITPTAAKLSSAPTMTPSRTPTVSPTPAETPEPAPTLSADESEAYVLELLQSNGRCELSCFWGIAPGKTVVDQAIQLTQHLGWTGGWYYHGIVYETGVDLAGLFIDVSFLDVDGRVEKIQVGVGGSGYARGVGHYSLANILQIYGVPTQVWINLATGLEIATPDKTAFNILADYQDQGILVDYGGASIRTGSSYRLCPHHLHYGDPSESETSGVVSMTLGRGAESSDELIEPFGLFDGMLTVEEALGMTVEEFHQQLTAETGRVICFQTPRSVWQ